MCAVMLCITQVPAISDTPAAASGRWRLSPSAVPQPLPAEQQAFDINDTLPTHDFGQGSQPFLLIELPPFQAPYEVRLRNEVKDRGEPTPQRFTRLVPHIQTLKSDYSPARSYPSARLRERSGTQEMTVFFNPPNQDERYLVVYGDLKARDTELLRSDSKTVFVGTGFFLDGADHRQVIHAAAQGNVQVIVKPLTPPVK